MMPVAEREKEKVTLHVRNKIVDALNETLPELIQVVLQCYDLMCGKAPGEYEPTVKFGGCLLLILVPQ